MSADTDRVEADRFGADRFEDWDAAYVLGALTPADRHAYEAHLAGCARCRDAVAQLSGLPGLLATAPVPDGDAAPTPPLPDLLPRLSGELARRRRRRRLTVAAAGLAAAAAVVTLVVVLLRPPAADSPTRVVAAPSPTTTATATGTTSGAPVSLALDEVTANPLAVRVTLSPEPWGTRIDLDCRFSGDGGEPGPNRAYGYALVVIDRSGRSTSPVTWVYGPDTTAEPVGTSRWPVDDIAALEVRGDDGRVLLRATR